MTQRLQNIQALSRLEINFFPVDKFTPTHLALLDDRKVKSSKLQQLELLPPDSITPGKKRYDQLVKSVDIDGIFGSVSFNDFSKTVKHCLEIQVRPIFSIGAKSHYVAKNKSLVNISRLQHCQIGCIATPVGKASIFYVSPGIGAEVHKEVLTGYLTTLVNEYNKVQTVGGVKVISKDLIASFIEHLKNRALETRGHGEDFLFIEIFGTKQHMSVHDIKAEKGLIELIEQSFNMANFPYMTIDLAVNISLADSIIFPKRKFFKEMNTKPNYYLFLNRNFCNSHQTLLKLGEGGLKTSSRLFEKLNFYSTLEDMLGPIRKYRHLPLIAHEYLKTDLAGHRPIASDRKLKKAKSSLSRCITSLSADPNTTRPYRVEVRIRPENIREALEKIESALTRSKYLVYNTSEVMNIVHKEAYNMLQLIESTDAKSCKSIFKAIFIENFLVNCFFKGSSNLQAVPKALHVYARESMVTDNRFFVKAVDFDGLVNNISLDQMLETFEKNIRYDGKMSDDQRNTLKCILSIAKDDLLSAAVKILYQYCSDIKRLYSLPAGTMPNMLKSRSYSTETQYTKEHLDVILVNEFDACENSKWLRLPYRCMISLYMLETGISSKLLLNTIKTVILNHEIDLLYNLKKSLSRPDVLMCQFVNLSGPKVQLGMFDKECTEHDRAILVNKLHSQIQTVRADTFTNTKWTNEEKIRFLAGQRIYSTINKGKRRGIWHYLSSSSLYGFMLTRDRIQMKDTNIRISSIKGSERTILDKRAASWSPLEFTLESMISELARFNIFLNEDAIATLRQLHSLDKREYILQMKIAPPPDDDILTPISIPSQKAAPVQDTSNILAELEKMLAQQRKAFNEDLIQQRKAFNEDLDTKMEVVKSYCDAKIEALRNELGMARVSRQMEFPYQHYDNHFSDDGVSFPCNGSDAELNMIADEIELSMESIKLLSLPESQVELQVAPPMLLLEPVKEQALIKVVEKQMESHVLATPLLLPEPVKLLSLPERPIKQRAAPPMLSELIEQRVKKPANSEKWMDILYEHYRYKAFSIADARKTCFSSNYRPAIAEWKNYIDRLITTGAIFNDGNKKIVRINLKIDDGKSYIKFDDVIVAIDSFLYRNAPKSFTTIQLAEKLGLSNSIDMAEIGFYCQDLLESHILTLVKTTGGIAYYKRNK